MRIPALLIALTTLGPTAALAQPKENVEEPGRLAAIQQRRYRVDHELFAAAGFLPLDAFYKGVGGVVSYGYHFTELYAWEVARVSYAFAFATGLRDQLQRDYGVLPTSFEEVQYLASTSALLTPLYGKYALVNRSVVHSEFFGIAGATLAKMTKSWKPGPQVGLGLRMYLARSLSFRFEARYHFLIAKQTTQVLDLAAGLSFDFGGAH